MRKAWCYKALEVSTVMLLLAMICMFVFTSAVAEHSTNEIQRICDEYGFTTGRYWSYSEGSGNPTAYTASDQKATTTTSTQKGRPGDGDYKGYRFAGGSECWAFAGFIGYKLSGFSNPYDRSWTKFESLNSLNAAGGIAVGDLIRTRNHSAIVYSISDNGNLRFVQCGGGINNSISVDGFFNWDSACQDLNSIIAKYGLTAIFRDPNSKPSAGDEWTYSFDNTAYKVIKGFNLKDKPYSDANVTRVIEKGSTVVAKRVVVNKYNNIWFELEDGGYAFGGLNWVNGTLAESGTQYFSLNSDNASVNLSGASLPQGNLEVGAGFELKGCINSSNSIKSVTAEVYSGETMIASSNTWTSENKTTQSLNLQPSIVNTTLKFGKLSEGNYTFKLNVEYYYDRTLRTAIKTIGVSVFSVGRGDSSMPTNPPDQATNWVYRVETNDGLNMRSGASTSANLVTTLRNPTTITVERKESADGYTWGYGTSSDGHTGWIVVDNNWTTLLSAPSEPYASTTGDDEFTIIKYDIVNCAITVNDMTYTGKSLKPVVTAKLNKTKLKKGIDYSVQYKNNKRIGKGTVIIKGEGQYDGKVKIGFLIKPMTVSKLKLVSGKKKVTVSWERINDVDGYQIQYGMKKDFSNSKKITVKKASALKKEINNLKTKKAYYVRVRTYKTVLGEKIYSEWSKSKKIIVK